MPLLKWLLVVLIIALTPCGQVLAQNKDPGLVPITASALTKAIDLTPIASSKHLMLIGRAAHSHLSKAAYEEYTLLWKKKPDDPYTNLYRAVSADSYWWNAVNPLLDHTLPLGSPQSNLLVTEAGKCFAKAIALRPNDPVVNEAYGGFKFVQLGQMPEGLVMIKKAETLAPNDPQVRTMLGEVYSNPAIPQYNPIAAEKELKTAINLDPRFAAPHKILANFYVDQKRYKESRNEINKYIALAPEGAASSKIVKFMESLIPPGR